MHFLHRVREEVHDAWLGFLHTLAMHCTYGRLKRMLYRLRGTKVGKGVDIGALAFIEDSYPEMVEIQDGVAIGPGVVIVAHESVQHNMDPSVPISTAKVVVERGAYIGAGAIILPGVTIGESAVVGAGAVVTKNVPKRAVFAGVPAEQIGVVTDEGEIVVERRDKHK